MRNYAIHQAEISGSLPGTGILAKLWRNWQARRAVAKLDQLDDFLLHDIGVTRGDIHQALLSPLSENAALVLESNARQRRRSSGLKELIHPGVRLSQLN